MDDLSLAWRNIWRNKRRSILTMLAVGFASLILVFMLSFQFGSYEEMINASVRLSTGHIQIMDRSYKAKSEMRKVIRDPGALDRILTKIDGISAYGFRATGFVMASGGKRTRGAMVLGVDPLREKRISTLWRQIRQGRYLSPERPGEVVVGRLLAERLKVGVGDELTLLGQGRDGSVAATIVTVGGIFAVGMDAVDRATIAMNLDVFQETFFMEGAVHMAVLMARDLRSVKGIVASLHAADLADNLGVYDWSELTPGLKESIQLDLVSGLIMYVILILVVAFSIVNTFLMAVFERTREFGVLLALGTAPGRLMKVVLMESAMMTALGIAAGMIGGALVTLWVQSHGISLGDITLLSQYGISGRLYPKLSLLTLVAGPSLVFVVTFAAALWPALKIRKLTPLGAMNWA